MMLPHLKCGQLEVLVVSLYCIGGVVWFVVTGVVGVVGILLPLVVCVM